jgi:hypothetical protein
LLEKWPWLEFVKWLAKIEKLPIGVLIALIVECQASVRRMHDPVLGQKDLRLPRRIFYY